MQLLHPKAPFIHSKKLAANGKPAFVILDLYLLDNTIVFGYFFANETLNGSKPYECLFVREGRTDKEIMINMPNVSTGLYSGKPLTYVS